MIGGEAHFSIPSPVPRGEPALGSDGAALEGVVWTARAPRVRTSSRRRVLPSQAQGYHCPFCEAERGLTHRSHQNAFPLTGTELTQEQVWDTSPTAVSVLQHRGAHHRPAWEAITSSSTEGMNWPWICSKSGSRASLPAGTFGKTYVHLLPGRHLDVRRQQSLTCSPSPYCMFSAISSASESHSGSSGCDLLRSSGYLHR